MDAVLNMWACVVVKIANVPTRCYLAPVIKIAVAFVLFGYFSLFYCFTTN